MPVTAWIRQIEKFPKTLNALSDDENQNIFESDGNPKFENVIFALQNYKDLWASSLQRNQNKQAAHQRLMVEYVNNIIGYHAFSGNKMIVKFEDVLNDYQPESQRISSFLDLKLKKPKFVQPKHSLNHQLRLKIDNLYLKRLGGLYPRYLADYAETQSEP